MRLTQKFLYVIIGYFLRDIINVLYKLVVTNLSKKEKKFYIIANINQSIPEMQKITEILVKNSNLILKVNTMDKIIDKNKFGIMTQIFYGHFTSSLNQFFNYVVDIDSSPGDYVEKTVKFRNKVARRLTIFVLLPFDAKKFKTYLSNMHYINLYYFDKIFLIFSSFNKTENEVDSFKTEIISLFPEKFQHLFRFKEFKQKFNRGEFLHHTLIEYKEKSVIFFSDIDFLFDINFVKRCIIFGGFSDAVYFPVVFSRYNPDLTLCKKNETLEKCGSWRYSGYGAVCLTRKAYIRSGGFKGKFSTWGQEDVYLYNRFKKRMTIFRITDEGISHNWHDKNCSETDLNKKNYIDCLLSVSRYEGSQIQLGLMKYCERHNLTYQNILKRYDLWKNK